MLDDSAARLALGVALRGLGRMDQAEAEYQRVLKAAPKNLDALYNLLVLHMDFNHNEKRARDYLTRFLGVAEASHPKHKDAKLRESEL